MPYFLGFLLFLQVCIPITYITPRLFDSLQKIDIVWPHIIICVYGVHVSCGFSFTLEDSFFIFLCIYYYFKLDLLFIHIPWFWIVTKFHLFENTLNIKAVYFFIHYIKFNKRIYLSIFRAIKRPGSWGNTWVSFSRGKHLKG